MLFRSDELGPNGTIIRRREEISTPSNTANQRRIIPEKIEEENIQVETKTTKSKKNNDNTDLEVTE